MLADALRPIAGRGGGSGASLMRIAEGGVTGADALTSATTAGSIIVTASGAANDDAGSGGVADQANDLAPAGAATETEAWRETSASEGLWR